jgi:hypothetical protein
MGTNSESVRLIVKIVVSDELKYFLWTPPKTASQHAVKVFSFFPFETFICSHDRKNITSYENIVLHNHNLNLFDGHENYKLICTARNPLKRIFSAYLFVNRIKNDVSISGFRDFFKQEIEKGNLFWTSGMKDYYRVPDYFIRQEHLYEDYQKIPFIKDSKLFSCGFLEELCQKKINKSSETKLDIKECYTEDMIHYVYTEYKDYFDRLGYTTEL